MVGEETIPYQVFCNTATSLIDVLGLKMFLLSTLNPFEYSLPFSWDLTKIHPAKQQQFFRRYPYKVFTSSLAEMLSKLIHGIILQCVTRRYKNNAAWKLVWKWLKMSFFLKGVISSDSVLQHITMSRYKLQAISYKKI